MFSKPPLAIQWYEGMLMRPQHLQQTHLRNEQLMSFYTGNLSCFPWGVLDLKFDLSNINQASINVLSMEAIMPDGTYINYHINKCPALNYNLDNIQKTECLLYVTIPKADVEQGFANQSSSNPRYLSVGVKSLKDQNSGQDEFDVSCLLPNLKLATKDDLNDLLIAMPIAKFSKALGAWEKINYTPPILKISNREYLWEVCNGIVSIVRNKVHNLLHRSLRDQGKGAVNQSFARAASILSYGFLEFDALLKVQRAHPFEIFLSLCRMASFISTIGDSNGLPMFEPYNHNEIDKSFEQAIVFIENILKTLQDNFSAVNLIKESNVFTVTLSAELVKGDYLLLGLRSSSIKEMDKVKQWFEGAIITTDSFQNKAIEHRTLGLRRKECYLDNTVELAAPKDMLMGKVYLDDNYSKIGDNLTILNSNLDLNYQPIEILWYIPKDKKV